MLNEIVAALDYYNAPSKESTFRKFWFQLFYTIKSA